MLGKVKSSFEHIGHIFNFQSLEVSLSHIRIDWDESTQVCVNLILQQSIYDLLLVFLKYFLILKLFQGIFRSRFCQIRYVLGHLSTPLLSYSFYNLSNKRHFISNSDHLIELGPQLDQQLRRTLHLNVIRSHQHAFVLQTHWRQSWCLTHRRIILVRRPRRIHSNVFAFFEQINAGLLLNS